MMFGRALKTAIVSAATIAAITASSATTTAGTLSLRERLAALVASYPEAIAGFSDGKLRFRDGGPAIAIDDGKRKIFAMKLAHADVEDMLSQIYPPGPCYTAPLRDFDPGRIRSEVLLKRLYGSTKSDVSRQLANMDWFGKRVLVTRAQGVAKALKKVRADIAKLPLAERRPAMKTAGAFNWRDIAGTRRLSVHSFGAAIDIDPAFGSYWRWSRQGKGGRPRSARRIPIQIVQAFERHGFIWGGRWYHYDSMHFEYRPELLAIAREAGISACQPR